MLTGGEPVGCCLSALLLALLQGCLLLLLLLVRSAVITPAGPAGGCCQPLPHPSSVWVASHLDAAFSLVTRRAVDPSQIPLVAVGTALDVYRPVHQPVQVLTSWQGKRCSPLVNPAACSQQCPTDLALLQLLLGTLHDRGPIHVTLSRSTESLPVTR